MSKEEPFRQKVTPDCQELPFSLSWRFLKTNVTWSCFLYDFFFYIIFFFFFCYPHSDLLLEIPHWGRTATTTSRVKGSQGPRLQVPNELVTTLHPPLPLCCLFCPGAFNLMSLIYYWPPLASFLGDSGLGLKSVSERIWISIWILKRFPIVSLNESETMPPSHRLSCCYRLTLLYVGL